MSQNVKKLYLGRNPKTGFRILPCCHSIGRVRGRGWSIEADFLLQQGKEEDGMILKDKEAMSMHHRCLRYNVASSPHKATPAKRRKTKADGDTERRLKRFRDHASANCNG